MTIYIAPIVPTTTEAAEHIDLDQPDGITLQQFENMAKGLKPCGCGTIDVDPSYAYPTGRKVVRCPRHRGVRVYGG